MRVYLRGIIERGSAVCGTGRNSTAKEGQRVVRLADRTRTAEERRHPRQGRRGPAARWIEVRLHCSRSTGRE